MLTRMLLLILTVLILLNAPEGLHFMKGGVIWNLKCSYLASVVVVVLLFYVHGKHLRSCRDGQLT